MNMIKSIKSVLFLWGLFSLMPVLQAASVEPIPEEEIMVLEVERVVPLEIILFQPVLEKTLSGKVVFYGTTVVEIQYRL